MSALAQKISNDEILTPSEEAYLKGWMDASSLMPRKNPYASDSTLAAEYDRGYTTSLCDCDER